MTQRALITGGTAGIGNAFAKEFARRGYSLVLTARDEQRLNDVARKLTAKHGVEISVLVADLSVAEGMNTVVNALTDSARPIDLLINNAGSSLAAWFGTTDIVDEERQLDLMVRAPMVLTDAAIKTMTGRGHGSIINVASVAAFTPRGTYSAHKMWIVNLSQWLNLHYGDAGVKVMALCPGFVHTEFHSRMGARTDNIPRWMWVKPQTVVNTALKDLDRGKAISVPTMRYKVLAFISRHAPPAIVARIAKKGR